MERLDFLKSIFSVTLLASVPFKSSAIKTDKFKFDEVFKIWLKNDNLIYFNPEHEVYKTIKSAIKERIRDKEKFKYYYPVRDIYIPIKEYYNMDDFTGLILYLTSTYNQFHYFCEYHQDVFIRLIKEKSDRMSVSMFAAKK